MKKGMLAALVFCGAGTAFAQTATLPEFSEAGRQGQTLFQEKCTKCHGKTALGTEQGPPLIHPFYRPGHHGDDAIRAAITGGVEAHHWQYGDMPPVEGVSDQQKETLVAFIRELQRANGIR